MSTNKKDQIHRFLMALQFLTIFPVKKASINQDALSKATLYFPLIGIILGLILAAIYRLLSIITLDKFLTDVILVTLLIILTAGLHLDGLADTFDALLSGKGKSEMLNVMRDSHIGVMGSLSLICVVLLKVSLLYSLPSRLTVPALILMCLLSRYGLVLAIFLFPYARSQGKTKVFIEGMNKKIFFGATIMTLLCAPIILKLRVLIILSTVIIFIFLLGKFLTRKIGGITGDTLGAISELAEVFVLLNVLILTRFWI